VETIIWDWNGTLLNDVDICVESINILLSERGHKPLSKSLYREIFTFPVKAYYELAGFDFTNESFDFEVAEDLGMNCLLVADGHQSKERLLSAGCDVVGQLTELIEKFNMMDKQ